MFQFNFAAQTLRYWLSVIVPGIDTSRALILNRDQNHCQVTLLISLAS